jgi:uncharacterized protein YceK
MKKIIQTYLSTIIVVMMVSGCATSVGRAFTPPGNETFYTGTEEGYKAMTKGDAELGERIFYRIDLPFSFIADTVLVPFDTYDYFKYKHDDKEKSANQSVDPTLTDAI